MTQHNPCAFASHNVSGVSLDFICQPAMSITLRIACGDAPGHEITLFCVDPLAVAASLREAAAKAHAQYAALAPTEVAP